MIHSEVTEEFNVLDPDTLFYTMIPDLNITISGRLILVHQDTRIFTVMDIIFLS
jgi:hypothetical protein